jgi:hypothetical protein
VGSLVPQPPPNHPRHLRIRDIRLQIKRHQATAALWPFDRARPDVQAASRMHGHQDCIPALQFPRRQHDLPPRSRLRGPQEVGKFAGAGGENLGNGIRANCGLLAGTLELNYRLRAAGEHSTEVVQSKLASPLYGSSRTVKA